MLTFRTPIVVTVGGVKFPSLHHAWSALHFFPSDGRPSASQSTVIKRISTLRHHAEVHEVFSQCADLWNPELRQGSENKLKLSDSLMRRLIIRILEENPTVAAALDGSQGELVYANTDHDCFWGRCGCGSDRCNDRLVKPEAGNRLGKLLMQIRDERSLSTVKVRKLDI